jgi:hypothetical protein
MISTKNITIHPKQNNLNSYLTKIIGVLTEVYIFHFFFIYREFRINSFYVVGWNVKITAFILRHLTFGSSESPYQTLNLSLNIIIYS